jgi:hypothetical protein
MWADRMLAESAAGERLANLLRAIGLEYASYGRVYAGERQFLEHWHSGCLTSHRFAVAVKA